MIRDEETLQAFINSTFEEDSNNYKTEGKNTNVHIYVTETSLTCNKMSDVLLQFYKYVQYCHIIEGASRSIIDSLPRKIFSSQSCIETDCETECCLCLELLKGITNHII